MSHERRAEEVWGNWRAVSRDDAEHRWDALQHLQRPQKLGKDWLAATRRRLIALAEMGILQPREQGRIAEITHRKLAPPDQDRLRKSGITQDLFAFAVASRSGGAAEPLASRFLQLSPGKRLGDGQLSFQVFINESTRLPVGMNIQMRGTDPARGGRPTYLRYDLDVVAMGEKAGPVTHFNAHWHSGDDPDGDDAEEHDPRLPSLVLDPLAVLDILIETFFPDGPADLTSAQGV